MEDKQSLLMSVTPIVILKAKTSEARDSISKNCLGNETISIWKFPFRIGRESHIEEVNGELVIYERHKPGDRESNHNVYFVDNRHFLQISRKYPQIENGKLGYFVSNRKSACGTIINTKKIASEDTGGTYRLKDGDIIKIGSEESPYLFEFITLSQKKIQQ